MFSYRSTLKQAWEITRKHKYLWLFGLFAAITSAGGSWEYNVIVQSAGYNLIDGAYMYVSRAMAVLETINNFFSGLGSMFNSGFIGGMNALSILIFSATIIAVFVWLGVCSQGALVSALKKILTGKKKITDIRYRENISVGHENFWEILGLNLLIKIFVSAAFFIVSLPLLLMSLRDSGWLAFFYIILFIIFVPLATGLALAVKYAIAYQVFEGKGFVASLEKGFKLFRKNWLVSFEMAIILFLVSFLASLAFVIVASLFLVPIFFFGLMSGALWVSFLVVFISILLVIFFGALLTTFQISSWTSLFVTLKDNSVLAKLERLFRRK